jgi:methionyl-tRNA formyltransferase
MRIVCIGQAAFGEKVVQSLLEKGEEIVGVYTPPDTTGKSDSMAQVARQAGIPVFQPECYKDIEVVNQYKELHPDLNVMAFVTNILPDSILSYPRMGTIQYHPSLLPRHRGGSAINWAIINGETGTGITIFWPDRGIDTGPILLQKEADILPDDTVGSLYFNKLFPLGVEAIMESIELIKQGRAPRITQDESQATYEGLCTEKEAIINWIKPVNEVYNLIRGTNPQPGATTFLKKQKLKIFDVDIQSNAHCGNPGEIVEIGADSFAVAANKGAILVKRVQIIGLPKIKAPEFVTRVGLKTGDRLGD